MTPALEALQLYRFYHRGSDEVFALRGVSVAVDAGEMVAVTGPSGSGKSTLLSCLAGLDEPDGGVVLVRGQRLSRRPEAEKAALRAASIGVLFQQDNLISMLTILQNITLAQRLAGRRNPDAALALLASVGLASRAGARPAQLSGGEAARAGLAVALANDPPVLLADEPTGETDSATAKVIVELLAARSRNGTAVLVATHNPAVSRACHREVQLLDGAIV